MSVCVDCDQQGQCVVRMQVWHQEAEDRVASRTAGLREMQLQDVPGPMRVRATRLWEMARQELAAVESWCLADKIVRATSSRSDFFVAF